MNELALNIAKMSSREIAELTGKEHRNVMRDIRDMLEQLRAAGGGLLNFERTYRDSQNKEQPEFLLPKRECLILVSGYSVLLRTRIIDRWSELEAAQDTAQKPTLPSTYLDALKELVATVEAKQALEAENGVLRPKALIVDRINDAEGLHTMSEAAKILRTGRTRLFKFLRQEHIFDVHNMPLQQYIPNRFVVKERPFMRGDERSVYAQVYVTGRGITWLTPKVAGLGPDGQGEFFE